MARVSVREVANVEKVARVSVRDAANVEKGARVSVREVANVEKVARESVREAAENGVRVKDEANVAQKEIPRATSKRNRYWDLLPWG